MKFADFQRLRESLLRERADVLDAAATNLYAALAGLIPPVAPAPKRIVHRCHIATTWVEHFGLPPESSRRALVCCGVRDGLDILFRHYARQNAGVWLPSDNYPVFGELARVAGLVTRDFPTVPTPAWPDNSPTYATEILVVTNPLKPLGRWLTDSDVAALTAWLAAHPGRRLVIDSVYTFESRFHPSTLRLLATRQAILLHSLTKGWLHPRLFGIALVPESDVTTLTPLFRGQPPPQSNLARARELMTDHAGMPTHIARKLASAQTRLISTIPQGMARLAPLTAPGYFLPVAGPWQDILDSIKVLGLPASTFGSQSDDITILSSLSFLK